MIRSRILIVMAERRVRSLAQVSREAGVSVPAVSRLANETAVRVDFGTLDALCKYFDCQPGDLLEYVAEEPAGAPAKENEHG